jgi:hypothetical protein
MASKFEPPVVPVDVRCTEPGCNCFREGVSGRLVKGGANPEYAAPEGEEKCPNCPHPNKRHRVVGETKSKSEKKKSV